MPSDNRIGYPSEKGQYLDGLHYHWFVCGGNLITAMERLQGNETSKKSKQQEEGADDIHEKITFGSVDYRLQLLFISDVWRADVEKR